MQTSLLQLNKAVYEFNKEAKPALDSICEPLFSYMPIKRFGYAQFLLDTNQLCEKVMMINTHLPSAQSYLFDASDNGKDFTETIKQTDHGQLNYFLWPEKSDDYILKMWREKHLLTKGISFYKRSNNFIESWCFAYGPDNDFIAQPNRQTISDLCKWIEYFNSKGFSLINAEKPLKHFPQAVDMSPFSQEPRRETFFSRLKLRHHYLKGRDSDLNLTKREYECLNLLARGKSIKEIAQSLKISCRTVESYLGSIKAKSGYTYKSELIKLYQDNMIERF